MKRIVLLFIGGLAVLALRAATNTTQPVDNGQEVASGSPYPLHDACNDGSLEQLNTAINTLTNSETIAIRINQQDGEGNTALHCAAKKNNLKMVQALLDAGASKTILNHSDSLPIDFITIEGELNNPYAPLLSVSDEARQALVMEAREKEIEAGNAIDEGQEAVAKVLVVEEDNLGKD